MPTPHESMARKLLSTASILNGFGWAALLGGLWPGIMAVMAGETDALMAALPYALGGLGSLALFSCLATMAVGLAVIVEATAPKPT